MTTTTIQQADHVAVGADRKERESFHEDVAADKVAIENGVMEGADYSGAVKKTSPEEFALVRKLDWHIMPTLWAMYFLNYVSLGILPEQLIWCVRSDKGLTLLCRSA
jgi:hypothetical protein